MKKLILASASPRRREILALAGFAFETAVSDKEERQRGDTPGEIVEHLAADKAADVAERMSDPCIVLGADTVVVYDGEIMGKPKNREDAENMLCRLAGRNHQVYTGVALLETGTKERIHTFHQKTEVYVYPMSVEEIEAYVATGEPMDKAGGYGIQGQFGMYIEKIDGDYLNVVGLPIARVYQEMKALGMLEKEVAEDEV